MIDPYPTQAEMDNSDWAYPRRGEPVNQFGGCSVDGVPAPCGYAAGLLNMGSAALCPGGDCGPRRVPARDSHGNITYTWGLLTATATGVGYSYSTHVRVNVIPDPDHQGEADQVGIEDTTSGEGQWRHGRGFAYLGEGNGLEGWLRSVGHHAQKFTSHASQKGFPCPPTVWEIYEGGEAVTSVLNSTWELAQKTDREEGGWVYMDKRGNLKAVRKDRDTMWDQGDTKMSINLWHPPEMKGWVVVATFHTHTFDLNPSETVPGFSKGDVDINKEQKVPGIILGLGIPVGAMGFNGYGPSRGYWMSDLPKRCQK